MRPPTSCRVKWWRPSQRIIRELELQRPAHDPRSAPVSPERRFSAPINGGRRTRRRPQSFSGWAFASAFAPNTVSTHSTRVGHAGIRGSQQHQERGPEDDANRNADTACKGTHPEIYLAAPGTCGLRKINDDHPLPVRKSIISPGGFPSCTNHGPDGTHSLGWRVSRPAAHGPVGRPRTDIGIVTLAHRWISARRATGQQPGMPGLQPQRAGLPRTDEALQSVPKFPPLPFNLAGLRDTQLPS